MKAKAGKLALCDCVVLGRFVFFVFFPFPGHLENEEAGLGEL